MISQEQRQDVTFSIERMLDSIRKNYRVIRQVTDALADFDGRKLSYKIGQTIEEALPNFRADYYREPNHERLAVRDKFDTYQFYLHYADDGDRFNFARFVDRHPVEHLAFQIAELKEILLHPERIDVVIQQIETFREAKKEFEAIRQHYQVIFNCLGKDYEDVLKR